MGELKIDLDSESIWLEDRWLKKEELAELIKQKLEAGDFAIAALSHALEQLVYAVKTARVVAFRVPPEMADALAAHAQQAGVSLGALMRHAVAQLLMAQAEAQAQVPPQATIPLEQAVEAPAPKPEVLQAEPATTGEGEPALLLRPKTTPAGAPIPAPSEAEKEWFRSR